MNSNLLAILHGLVPLHIARLQNDPRALDRARDTAGAIADTIAGSGDRLTAPGNFQGPKEQASRRQALNALVRALALGAYQPGGITWSGAHWCVRPHDHCPNRPQRPIADDAGLGKTNEPPTAA
ncbi:hypothetical protein ACWGCW_00560 [Streptomyces sp. NPDC054933]